MQHRAAAFFVSSLVGFAFSAPAHASVSAYEADAIVPAVTSALADLKPDFAPIAFVRFCLSYEAQCRSNGDARVIVLTGANWAAISNINARINRRIRPDPAKGPFDWSLETLRGNCNDYAVQKRQALIEAGFPPAALSLSTVVTASDAGHLVLTLRTDRGDFVLDNLRQAVLPWTKTGYRWIKRQSAEDPMVWVSVSSEGRPLAVQAAVTALLERWREPRWTVRRYRMPPGTMTFGSLRGDGLETVPLGSLQARLGAWRRNAGT